MTAQRYIAAVAALALTLASVTPLLATEGSDTGRDHLIGSRVRIATSQGQHEDERLVGEVLAVEADSLLIRPLGSVASTQEVPLRSITRFEVYEGRSRRGGKGALIGMASGAMSGVVLGVMSCRHGECDSNDIFSTEFVATFLGAVGLGLGAAGD